MSLLIKAGKVYPSQSVSQCWGIGSGNRGGGGGGVGMNPFNANHNMCWLDLLISFKIEVQ